VLITYIRSSSYNEFDLCEHKYYIDFVLGWHSPAGLAAQKGTIVHKALEILAQRKLAEQQGDTEFINYELGLTFSVQEITPEAAIELSFDYYKRKGEFEYSKADFKDCNKWMNQALLWHNGMFSPLKMNILASEKYFDIEIMEPWAAYSYKLADGSLLEGQLRLKGTIDLVVQRSTNVIEIVDWKTGKCMNWNKMKKKEYDDFYSDPQLLLYHYAARKLYPEVEEIFFTIFYLQEGGPFSIAFQKSDIKKAEQMLRDRFNAIRNTKRPSLIWPSFKCKWCYFSKHKLDDSLTDNYNDTICKKIKDEIVQLGISRVTHKRSKDKSHSAYVEGGGRTHDSK
jgi:hypothetical protein